jgi:hypothetical protein
LRKIGQGILPTVLYGAKKMNMISTGAFLTEMDASKSKQDTTVSKLVKAWEKKNSKTAKAGGVSLMALSVAACGSSDDTSDTVSYTQAQLDAAKVAATSAAEASAATAAAALKVTTDAAAVTAKATSDAAAVTAAAAAQKAQVDAVAAAVSAVDKTTDNAAAILTAVQAVDASATTVAEVASNAKGGTTNNLTLTVASDTVTGTTGNDTVTGARIDSVQTLNGGDVISLGAGTGDKITANINAGTVAPTITGVETIQLTALGAGTLDLANTTGVTSIVNSASSAALTVDNIAALAPITIANTDQATTIVFKAAAAAGAADSLTLNLNDVSGGIITIGSESDANGSLETINIVSTGTNVTGNLDFGATATTVNVTGAGSTDLNASDEFPAFTSFDGSAATGAIDVAFSDRATTSATLDLTVKTGSGADDVDMALVVDADVDNLTIDLGAGNDRLILDANTDTGNSIDGGAGTDILQLDIAMTATVAGYVSNFETLEINGPADLTQDMDSADGMNTVNIFDMTASSNDLNIDDAADGIVINANGALLAATAAGASADMTILSVDLKSDGATDDMTLNLNASAGGVSIADFLPNSQFETVTVTSSGTAANTIVDISSAKTNMVISGATALTVTGTGALLGVLDASAMTGALTTTTSTTALTIKGGSAGDTFTSGLLATGITQTLNGGAGNDTLTAGQIVTTGNLVLNGDAGSDTINVADMDGNTTGTVISTAVLDGGAGIDFLTLDAVNTVVLVNIGSTATTAADADVVIDFDTTEDDYLYTGGVSNDTVTTMVASLNTTFATALSSDVNATVYIDSGNLTGSAASTLTTLANARTAEAVSTAAASFESALAAAEGTVALLDNTIGAGESVLVAFENGTDTAVLRFTNSDTSTANTMTAAELEVIAVFDAAVLVAADFT